MISRCGDTHDHHAATDMARFFTEAPQRQRRPSPHTVTSREREGFKRCGVSATTVQNKVETADAPMGPKEPRFGLQVPPCTAEQPGGSPRWVVHSLVPRHSPVLFDQAADSRTRLETRASTN